LLGLIDRGNGSGRSNRFWTCDPVDGTKGFLRGEQYAVCLALLVDGQVKVGVLGCPNLSIDARSGIIFGATEGHGAFYVYISHISICVYIKLWDINCCLIDFVDVFGWTGGG
jgi:3'(2'), 5'-bisphosphate nucleotidase